MKPKQKQEKRQSLRSRAYESCGRCTCMGCYNLTRGEERVCEVCRRAYVDGYTKGWKASRRELK